jgi:hypothetical protein
MKKHLRRSAAFFALIIILVACASPIRTDETESSDQVATVVAMTFQALAPEIAVAPTNTPEAPTSVPEVSTSLLPRSLYFLGKDNQWISQVYRLERDGKTKTQLTFEPVSVDDYDISLADGTIAYVANNQLLLSNADGSNRRVLVDGGPREANNPWVTSAVFPPDGKTLAYGHNGLNLYDLGTGTSSLVIEDQLEAPQLLNGIEQSLPIETYWPERYSPDGTKLLINLGYFEGTTAAIYDPVSKDLVRFTKKNGNPLSHYGLVDWSGWSEDSSSVYAAVPIPQSAYRSGEIWWVDTATGAVTTLLPIDAEDRTMRFPDEPYLAPDGQLYYFYGTYSVDSGFFEPPVLELVHSAPDDLTDRIVLSHENFRLVNEALWAPDASFVIVATLPERSWNQSGGVLELYPTDGQKDKIWLTPYGGNMKWGP